MERICPFLALESDARTAIAGYDADHRCLAELPPARLDRSQQANFCLEPAHRSCPVFVAAMAIRREGETWAHPAFDAELLSTRLVLAPDSPRRIRRAAPGSAAARRWAFGGALAVVGVAAVAGGVTGALGSLPGRNATDSPSDGIALDTPAAATQLSTAAPATSTPVPETPAATATHPVASASATTAPAPSRAAEVQTYVVQPGDTLHDIAVRFGTTVAGLQDANGLGSSDVIVVGQVLIVP